ncbi:MAG TPA: hypothetical protein VM537_34605 [Anaerolineae bacterium]|nr:hypothetical protein [Anaerolineae bacterium]
MKQTIDDLGWVMGRTVVGITLHIENYDLALHFEDGTCLEIGVDCQFCDDAWLTLEKVEGKDGPTE